MITFKTVAELGLYVQNDALKDEIENLRLDKEKLQNDFSLVKDMLGIICNNARRIDRHGNGAFDDLVFPAYINQSRELLKTLENEIFHLQRN